MNKQIFKILFFACVIVFTSVSCEVDEIDDTNIDNQDPTTPEEGLENLSVSSSFEWATSTDYKINFQGLPVSSSSLIRPLIIRVKDGDVLRTLNITLSDDVTIDLRVPSREQTLVLSWGSLEKELNLDASSSIDFTFINPDNQDDQ